MAPRNTTSTDLTLRPAARSEVDAALTLAFASDHPTRGPRRFGIRRAIQAIELGRGEGDGWHATRDATTLSLALDDRLASTHHARIARAGSGWQLEDLASKNGTRVDGVRVERAPLVDGAVIELGGTFLVWRDREPGDDAEPRGPHPSLLTLSAPLERELELLARIARAGVPLLVRGASGTGKEVAARAVHELSGRGGAFVGVNCAALPPTLIASELFGSVRGAFSGAEQREGLVRAAHGGTLFLDEIAELDVEAQASLLRVLQEREVLPVGATRPIKVDLRVIAATHQPLDELARTQRFRHDLLARLRGYQFVVPDLRERREDLGLLIARLLARIEPARAWRFRRAAAAALFRHGWPLHVRELDQALRAATAVATGDEIGLDDLPVTVVGEPAAPEPPQAAAEDPRARFVALVAEHRGNVTRIAAALATSRSQIRRLAARYGVALTDARDG